MDVRICLLLAAEAGLALVLLWSAGALRKPAHVLCAALLLAVRGGDTLVTLDDSLNQLASVAAGQAKSVSSTATAVYLLTASGVESYGYDGTHNWSRDYGAAPQAVINARETLVFISGTVEVLNAPHE